MTLGRGLSNAYFLYKRKIRGRSSLRIHSLAAGITLIAARFAPVAPQGEIQTLGEHGLPLSTVRPTCATGAPVYGAWRLWN